MAVRQEEEMASQRQLLAAKEQRLRYLKEHEARHAQVAQEHDRLRRLRDRVEAQELKLSKLRALRGQVDHNKATNATLTSDLDSIRALFNEKEKELTMAVAKVEELTRQLEEVRRGRQPTSSPPASQELERLRRELMYRNKLNEQQSARLSEQREVLCQRQIEMASIDKRIAELQERLHRKRVLNQQLANQITAASNKANSGSQHNNRSGLPGMGLNQQSLYHLGASTNSGKLRTMASGNIAAVEPYHHVPTTTSYQQSNLDQDFIKQSDVVKSDGGLRGYTTDVNQEDVAVPRKGGLTAPAVHHYVQETTKKEPVIPGGGNQLMDDGPFVPNKSDPKYQTLPYNTKFQGQNNNNNNNSSNNNNNNSVAPSMKGNIKQQRSSAEGNENTSENIESSKINNNSYNHILSNNNLNTRNDGHSQQQQQQQMSVVHSIPIPAGASKGLATGAVSGQVGSAVHKLSSSASPTSSTSSYSSISHLGQRLYGNNLLNSALMVRGQPVGGASSTNSSTSSLATSSSTSSANGHQVLPTTSSPSGLSLTQSNVTSRLTLPPTPLISDIQKPVNSVSPSSTQQHLSTIYQTSSTKIQPVQPQTINPPPQVLIKEESETTKPALPPKPATPVKPTPPPPPRQTHNSVEVRPGSEETQQSGLTVLRPTTQVSHINKYNEVPTEPPPPLPSSEPPEDPLSNNRRLPANELAIKPRPLTIKKQPSSELPRLRNFLVKDDIHLPDEKRPSIDENLKDSSSSQEEADNQLCTNNDSPCTEEQNSNNGSVNTGSGLALRSSRRIEMPPEFLFPETPAPPIPPAGPGMELSQSPSEDQTDRSAPTEESDLSDNKDTASDSDASTRRKKGNLKSSAGEKQSLSRRVSFDPLALLLDASLEGELELVIRTASQVGDPSAANDEGITALHNAICAGHFDIVDFLVTFGCDVNAQDSDGWTPLHCAASCNNVAMVRFLVEHGACIFATTLSDHETAAEKCEEDEEGFDGCSEYLYSVQEKLGIMNNGVVYAVYDYEAHNSDELTFKEGDRLLVLRKGDEWEREWWWARLGDKEGYIPRNLLGLYPRVHPNNKTTEE
uniref:Putative apoptosis stimulating of p53 n=1 Tax=Panstrongylus megistus TaxID=65343 RepID=A0A069DXM2_9HEMI